MIKSIRIENFQSHADSQLDLCDGVNVIVGPSDSGKSAVLRAVKWVVTNRPSGEEFRSRRGGDTQVTIDVDGERVVRFKGGKENSYSLNDGTFKAMGVGVPAEVDAALQMASINTQSQMDGPFLLGEEWSPGRVAEYLNEAVGLSVIDGALSRINAKARDVNWKHTLAKEDVERLGKEREALAYLDEVEELLVEVEALRRQQASTRSDEADLNAIVVEIVEIVEKANSMDWISDAEKDIEKLTEIDRLASQKWDASLQIKEAVAEIDNIQTSMNTLIDVEKAEGLIVETEALIRKQDDLKKEADEIDRVCDALDDVETQMRNNDAELKKLDDRWRQVAPDACPLCDGTGRLR